MAPHILVVEDDPDLAMSIGQVLEAAGYRVSIAEHGLAALGRLLSGLRPSLILLDMMMPIMDGWAFRAEQTKLPDADGIPLVAVTADGNAKRKAEAIHANGYLAKPVKVAALLDTVEQHAGPAA